MHNNTMIAGNRKGSLNVKTLLGNQTDINLRFQNYLKIITYLSDFIQAIVTPQFITVMVIKSNNIVV
uniref:Uncharacterized protein n=1 Tax=Glossina morsitans morsitans TaxID=37546 RepID=A0A1B0GBB6_GLOMM